MQWLRVVFIVRVLTLCCDGSKDSTGVRVNGGGETAQVVREIIKHFHSDCVVLLTNDNFQENRCVKEVSTYLSMNNLPSAAVHVNMTFDDVRKRGRGGCNRLLYVVLFYNVDVRASLIQIANVSNLSKAKWLIFLQDATFDDRIHIPFNCDFLLARSVTEGVRITEVYHVAANLPLQTNVLGLWRSRGGFPRPELDYHKRRGSLQGAVLRSSFYHAPPRVVLKHVASRVEMDGFCGDVWRVLEEKMNFTSSHRESPVRSSGYRTKKRWFGVTAEVLKREVNMSSMTIAMTRDKIDVVDFGHPLFLMQYRIYIRKPEGTLVHWSDFLSPFSASLWLTFIASSFFTTFVMTFTFQVLRHFGASEVEYHIFDSLFMVFGASFCQQGQDKLPRTLSCRIVFMVVYIVGVIVINSYSASLISNLTVTTPLMPFRTIRELRDDDSFSVGMILNATIHEMFKATKIQVFKDLYKTKVRTDPKNLPLNYVEAFERVCTNRFALIVQTEVIYSSRIPCMVIPLPESLMTLSASYIFPKNSPYKQVFNYNILKLMESGVMMRLYMESIITSLGDTESTVKYKSIGLQEVTPFLLIMGCGIVSGILILTWELWGRGLLSWSQQQARLWRPTWQRSVKRRKVTVLPYLHTNVRVHKPNPAVWQPRRRDVNHVVREVWQGAGLFVHTEYMH